jgi:hypothetical protein
VIRATDHGSGGSIPRRRHSPRYWRIGRAWLFEYGRKGISVLLMQNEQKSGVGTPVKCGLSNKVALFAVFNKMIFAQWFHFLSETLFWRR